MKSILLLILLTCWLSIIYHHIVYPIILKFLSKKERNKTTVVEQGITKKPTLTILVPAFNEAKYIVEKIRNVASLDYPSSKLKLIIACDGCTDATAELAREATHEPENSQLDIEIIEFKKNRGKIAILNTVIKGIDSEIVALSDASALISLDALNKAFIYFNDSKLAVVAGTYKLLNPKSTGEEKYWQYQVNIKKGESAIGSPVGVHGALYFFRRDLFKPLKADTINDDFMIPMSMVAAGYNAVYDCDIIALELEGSDIEQDQRRRMRIAAGNIQQLLRLHSLLTLRHKGTALSFISGKALRAIMPLILLAQLSIVAILSFESSVFFYIFLSQSIVIALARISLVSPKFLMRESKISKTISMIFYLTNSYIVCLFGTFRYLIGLDKGSWKSVSNKEISL